MLFDRFSRFNVFLIQKDRQSKYIQGCPKRMRLFRRLYGICPVLLFTWLPTFVHFILSFPNQLRDRFRKDNHVENPENYNDLMLHTILKKNIPSPYPEQPSLSWYWESTTPPEPRIYNPKNRTVFKVTLRVIPSDPSCKDGNARFTTVPFKAFSD